MRRTRGAACEASSPKVAEPWGNDEEGLFRTASCAKILVSTLQQEST